MPNVDGYMYFMDYQSKFMLSESQVDMTKSDNDTMFKDTKIGKFKQALTAGSSSTGGSSSEGGGKGAGQSGLFEIEDFSFGIEQTLNIGSQSTGAGAGKVTFNAFTVNRKIDQSSPRLFQMACSGTPFQEVGLALRKSGGGDAAGKVYLIFRFKLVAVKTINWSYDEESPKEAVEFEYGGLQVFYGLQKPDGSISSPVPGGWNRVKNVADVGEDPIK